MRRQDAELRSREASAEYRRQYDELRSHEASPKLRRQAELRSHEASAKLRRPPSFERIRPPQVYERGRTGFHEQSSRPRSRSGWRLVSSSGKGKEGTLKATADVDREIVHIRGWRETNDEGTEELPGSPHESDCDPTSSPSKGALVIYQGKMPRDGTPERSRKTYLRKCSDATSMSQRGASVTHKVKEERDEAIKQLPGRYGIDSVDTIDSQTGALVIWREEEPEDKSAEGLPKQVGRRVTERDTNQVHFGEMSSDDRGRDLPGASINQGMPHGESLPISEDDPYGSNFGKTDLSLENDLDQFSNGSLKPKRDRRASVGGFRRSFSDDDITIRRAERRIPDRSRTDRSDSDISPSSDGIRSADSKYSFSRDRLRYRPGTRSPI